MKTKIILTLHKYDHFLILDSQDCYNYIGEQSKKEVELGYYIEMLCGAKNRPLLSNPNMAYDDGVEFQLKGWVDGYDFAKHHKISCDSTSGKKIIEGSWYVIEYEEPFEL